MSANAHCADEARPPYDAKTWHGNYFRETLLFYDGVFPLPSIEAAALQTEETLAPLGS
jgi:hypothetical protein